MMNLLVDILVESGLASLFESRIKEDNSNKSTPWVAYRVNSNLYKIRSFELWGTGSSMFFRIWGPSINDSLKAVLESLPGLIVQDKKDRVDYRTENYVKLASMIKEILLTEEIIKECKASGRYARASKFEGLELPDVDTSMVDVMGQTFTWRDIIAIWEDNTEGNKLKETLSRKGVYIQRSEDGKSRYIGSAYGENGIIGRWIDHLNSLGDAQHLNLFVLENGYNSVLFSVIEFLDGSSSEIIRRESMWKKTLGTINYGPYNRLQLNNN